MKQAVIVIHGMGEQVPMDTLNSFVEATWTTDPSLTNPDIPDPDTGEARTRNASWAKPDQRNNSFELRRVTTESDVKYRRTDFYEYYWAHQITGNTWEHVKPWLTGLILRNPFKRVPAAVRFAWCVMAIVAAIIVYLAVVNMWDFAHDIKPAPLTSFVLALAAVAGGYVLNSLVIPRLGDVARYIKATPPNVANRQRIRLEGVALLERLMDDHKINSRGKKVYTYDRVVVAAHSLGTIVAYDILTHAYGRRCKEFDVDLMKANPEQPARLALETAIRNALKDPQDGPEQAELDIDAYQDLQDAARAELNKTGNRWIVSDFVTMGSPLTHAEFLMAWDKDQLRANQASRILPTCPPNLEYDKDTDQTHYSFRKGSIKKIKLAEDTAPENAQPRLPHHAALFAFTRWSNLYSKHRFILKGDLVSGPVADQFALAGKHGDVKGIKDIPVLPDLKSDGTPVAHMSRGWVTHNNYWSMKPKHRAELHLAPDAVPHHIAKLRDVLRLAWKP